MRLLSATASLVSSVRQYLIALPPDALIANSKGAAATINFLPQPSGPSSTRTSASRDAFKRQSSFLGLPRGAGSAAGLQAARSASMVRKSSEEAQSTPLKQRTATYATLGRPDAPMAVEPALEDPLVRVRKAALIVLGALRALDERLRLADDQSASTLLSSGSSVSGTSEASLGTSLKSEDAASSRRGSFDVGHLYRDDVRLSDLVEEQKAVQDYVAIVDGVLAAHAPLQRLSHTGSRRNASSSPVKHRHARRAATEADDSPLTKTTDLPALMLNTGESEVDSPREIDGEHDTNLSLPLWARGGPFQGGELGECSGLSTPVRFLC